MSHHAIAVDIGGSHVEYGVVCDAQLIASERFLVAEPSLLHILPQLKKEIPSLTVKSGLALDQMTGIAIGICAIADGGKSVFAASGKYQDAVGFDFDQWSKRTFGLPCRVDNDARMALRGEHFAGAARGFDDAVLVTLGTGIGGAVMLGGQLLTSIGHKAGGLAGHLGVALNGRLCGCGNRGCAEAEASTAALDAICREHPQFAQSALALVAPPLGFQSLFAAMDAGDLVAEAMLNHCINVWSALAVTLIHAYDPQAIVFAGGVMKRHEYILSKIRAHVDRYAWTEKGSVQIVPAQLGSAAAILGAVPLLCDLSQASKK